MMTTDEFPTEVGPRRVKLDVSETWRLTLRSH